MDVLLLQNSTNKHIAVELICAWCFPRTAVQIPSSISHYHPSKEKKQSQGGKTETIAD